MSQLSIEDHVFKYHAVMDANSKRHARESLEKRISELKELIEDIKKSGGLEDYVEMFTKDLNKLEQAYRFAGGNHD